LKRALQTVPGVRPVVPFHVRHACEKVRGKAASALTTEYVWTAHEPPALKAGLQQEIIDIVKFRRPLTKMGEKETVIVQMGRDV